MKTLDAKEIADMMNSEDINDVRMIISMITKPSNKKMVSKKFKNYLDKNKWNIKKFSDCCYITHKQWSFNILTNNKIEGVLNLNNSNE
jgi:hypothetical protein